MKKNSKKSLKTTEELEDDDEKDNLHAWRVLKGKRSRCSCCFLIVNQAYIRLREKKKNVKQG